MEKIKFKCLKCGECCKNISDADSKSKGLPLFEWELDSIKKLAEEKKIKIELKPIDIIFDKKSKLYFCTGYIIPIEPCIFLKNNGCLIHKNRPLICKAFPIAKSPEFIKEVPNLSCFSKCPNLDCMNFLKNSLGLEEGKPFSLTKEKMIEKYKQAFDKETLEASFNRDNIFNYIESIIQTLSDEGIIDIEICKEKNNINPLSFSQFLTKIGIIKSTQ